MLEVGGKDALREFEGVEDDEAVVGPAPSDEVVRRRVANHLVSLHNERRDNAAAAARLHIPIYVAPPPLPSHPSLLPAVSLCLS